MGVSVCLSVDDCFYFCVSMCLCVYIIMCVCLSVCLSVVCLAVGRSICLPFSRSVSLSVCGQSVYVPICVPLSVYICLSVCLSLSLSVCRSVVSLSELSVSHGVHEACRQRRREGHDAENESGRLCIQERQSGLMNVELRTGAESRGWRARS